MLCIYVYSNTLLNDIILRLPFFFYFIFKHLWNQIRGYWTPNLHIVILNFARKDKKWILCIRIRGWACEQHTLTHDTWLIVSLSSFPFLMLIQCVKPYRFADCRLFFFLSHAHCVHARFVFFSSSFTPKWTDFHPSEIDFKIITSSCWS